MWNWWKADDGRTILSVEISPSEDFKEVMQVPVFNHPSDSYRMN
jgi:hypothetical protein